MKSRFQNLLSILNGKIVIITIILVFFGSFGGIFTLGNKLWNANFFDQMLSCLTLPFNIILIFLAISINIISLSNDIKNNTVILRYKDFQSYLKENFKYNILYISILFLISLFLTIFSCLILTELKIVIVDYQFYHISNLLYFFFYLFRTIVFVYLISTIIFYFNQKFGNKLTLFFLIIFLIQFVIPLESFGIQTKINGFPLLLSTFFSLIEYKSFLIEIIYSLVYFGIMLIFLFFLKYLCIRKRKDI